MTEAPAGASYIRTLRAASSRPCADHRKQVSARPRFGTYLSPQCAPCACWPLRLRAGKRARSNPRGACWFGGWGRRRRRPPHGRPTQMQSRWQGRAPPLSLPVSETLDHTKAPDRATAPVKYGPCGTWRPPAARRSAGRDGVLAGRRQKQKSRARGSNGSCASSAQRVSVADSAEDAAAAIKAGPADRALLYVLIES